jgi:hypothetical protein
MSKVKLALNKLWSLKARKQTVIIAGVVALLTIAIIFYWSDIKRWLINSAWKLGMMNLDRYGYSNDKVP